MTLKSDKVLVIVFLIPFLLSFLLRYNYTNFPINGSIPLAQMLTAESIAREGNYNINEYSGAVGADQFEYKQNLYIPHSPLNSLISSIPLFFTNGAVSVLKLRIPQNVNQIDALNSFASGLIQAFCLGGISALLYLLFTKQYKIKNKYFLVAVPLFATLSTFLFNYAVSFSNHIEVAFLVLLSFYAFLLKKYWLAGIAIAIAFWGEYPVGILGGIYFVWLIYEKTFKQNFLKIAIPIGISVILILAFNTLIFDKPLNFGEILYERYNPLGIERQEINPSILKGIYIGTLSPLKGVIWYFPIILFSIYLLIKYRKTYKKEAFIIFSYAIFTIIFYSLWNNCWGDSPLGPRHLASVIPLMIIPLGYPLAQSKQLTTKLKIYLATLTLWGISFYVISLLNVIDGLPRHEFVICEHSKFTFYEKALNVVKGNSTKFAPIIMKNIN